MPQKYQKPDFDPDLLPTSQHNQDAAKARGLRFHPRHNAFVDEDGCLARDRFGQKY